MCDGGGLGGVGGEIVVDKIKTHYILVWNYQKMNLKDKDKFWNLTVRQTKFFTGNRLCYKLQTLKSCPMNNLKTL